jgi:uncharacterized protein (TIGR02421 family)
MPGHKVTTGTLSAADRITPAFITQVQDRLRAGHAVRRSLPGGGRVHIDRALPFLCVYREPGQSVVGATSQLVVSEAAYLIASGSEMVHPALAQLVTAIADVMREQFGGFLLLELWVAATSANRLGASRGDPVPTFRIISPTLSLDDPTVRALTDALRRIPLRPPPLDVEVQSDGRPMPPGVPELLPATSARSPTCPVIGIEVEPVYRHAGTGTPYPVLFETLRHGMARALRQTAYHYAQRHTALEPTHYHALGRRTAVRAVHDADTALTTIARSFDFLLQVTPVNAEHARVQFMRDRMERDPEFDYRPLIVDVSMLQRQLYNLPLERLEDPTLSTLLTACRNEMSRKLTMLTDRNTARFLYGSLSVYGRVSDALYDLAVGLLDTTRRDHETDGGAHAPAQCVTAARFAAMAREELATYRRSYPALVSKVKVRSDVTGVLVSDGDVLIGSAFRATRRRAFALLHHEIGTHVITYYNGRAQPLQQLAHGLAGYEQTQEGLAVLAEYLMDALTSNRVRLLAGRVLAVHALLDGAPFVENFRMLTTQYDFAPGTAFTICMRVYRSGGFTKDLIYLLGLQDVLGYLRDGGEMAPLFIGKLGLHDVPAIQELQWREYVHPARVVPRFLVEERATARLQSVRRVRSLAHLLTEIPA